MIDQKQNKQEIGVALSLLREELELHSHYYARNWSCTPITKRGIGVALSLLHKGLELHSHY